VPFAAVAPVLANSLCPVRRSVSRDILLVPMLASIATISRRAAAMPSETPSRNARETPISNASIKVALAQKTRQCRYHFRNCLARCMLQESMRLPFNVAAFGVTHGRVRAADHNPVAVKSHVHVSR